MQRRELAVGTAGVAAIAALMLAYAVFGHPPYSYFGLLKWCVVGADLLTAVVLIRRSLANLPLGAILAASGAVELLGKMHREQWAPYNEINGAAFILAAGGLAYQSVSSASRTETEKPDLTP